jgi:acyl-CoA hydrolase
MAEAKAVRDSETTLVQLMEIAHANIAGIVHGGEVMKLVDTAAGIAAIKHAGGMCVTVSIDEMSFLHPVHVGDLVTVQACVTDVGTTSLEVGVHVEVEMVGERRRVKPTWWRSLDETASPGDPAPSPRPASSTAVVARRRSAADPPEHRPATRPPPGRERSTGASAADDSPRPRTVTCGSEPPGEVRAWRWARTLETSMGRSTVPARRLGTSGAAAR